MAVFTGNGSAASPSITFSSDTDTGLFRLSANSVALAGGGTPIAKFNSDTLTGGTPDGVAGLAGGNYNVTPGYAGAGTNLAGGTLSIFPGRGTGNSAASLLFYAWQQQASGTTNQPAQLAGGFHQTGVSAGNVFRLAAASQGIQFNGDTAAANALDDYEEGTWTPQSTANGLIDSSGRYIKIGRFVWGNFRFTVDSTTLAIIRLLPVPVSASIGGNVRGVISFSDSMADANAPYQLTSGANNYIDIVKNDGGAVSHNGLNGHIFEGHLIYVTFA